MFVCLFVCLFVCFSNIYRHRKPAIGNYFLDLHLIEKLYSTATNIIFDLGRTPPHTEALKIANYHSLCYKYKIADWENLPFPLCDSIISTLTSRYPSRTRDCFCTSFQLTIFPAISRLDIEVLYYGIIPWPMIIQL